MKADSTNYIFDEINVWESCSFLQGSSNAYSNEIALICEKIGLDAKELIISANKNYPRNKIPSPSPGVGGSCLSKDPYFLVNFAEDVGYSANLIKEARNINENVTTEMVERIENKLSDLGREISKSKVFIIGFAFKGHPEISDMRESTTLWFLNQLRPKTSRIYGYDPVVNKSEIENLGVTFCDDINDGFRGADVVIFFNNHKSYSTYNIKEIIDMMNKPGIFFDSWRLFDKDDFRKEKEIIYMGVGL